MVSKMFAMREKMVQRKWFFIEAVICILPALTLFVSALPYGFVFLISPQIEQGQSEFGRFMVFFMFFVGVFDFIVLWKLIFIVVQGGRFYCNWVVFLAVILGVWVSYDFSYGLPMVVNVFIFLPLWVFIGHLFLFKR